MNTVQSPVFITFCSIADKVGLRFFSSVHDPATNSSKFPGVRWFLRRLGLDVPHIQKNYWKVIFLKLEFCSWPAFQWQKYKLLSNSDAMVTLTPPTPKPKWQGCTTIYRNLFGWLYSNNSKFRHGELYRVPQILQHNCGYRNKSIEIPSHYVQPKYASDNQEYRLPFFLYRPALTISKNPTPLK